MTSKKLYTPTGNPVTHQLLFCTVHPRGDFQIKFINSKCQCSTGTYVPQWAKPIGDKMVSFFYLLFFLLSPQGDRDFFIIWQYAAKSTEPDKK